MSQRAARVPRGLPWLARILPRLPDAAYPRWAVPIERILGHLPMLGWLGGYWLVVAQPAVVGPCPDRTSCALS